MQYNLWCKSHSQRGEIWLTHTGKLASFLFFYYRLVFLGKEKPNVKSVYTVSFANKQYVSFISELPVFLNLKVQVFNVLLTCVPRIDVIFGSKTFCMIKILTKVKIRFSLSFQYGVSVTPKATLSLLWSQNCSSLPLSGKATMIPSFL